MVRVGRLCWAPLALAVLRAGAHEEADEDPFQAWAPLDLPPPPTLAPLPAPPVLPGLVVPAGADQGEEESERRNDTAEGKHHHSEDAGHRSQHGREDGADDTEKKHLRLRKTSTRTDTTTTSTATSTTRTTTTRTMTSTTTTTNTCEMKCVVNDVSTTCKERIQQSSLNDFLGEMNSCELAQEQTAAACPICGGCPAPAAGCGVIEAPPTTTPTPVIPEGGSCQAICELGGQPATCTARILWSADNLFASKDDACAEAHKMVLGQCPICATCKAEKTKCVDASILAAEEAKADKESKEKKKKKHHESEDKHSKSKAPADDGSDDESYDCTLAHGWQAAWSPMQRAWCCEHKDRGCDSTDNRVSLRFKQKKFDSSLPPMESMAGNAQAPLAGRAASLGALGALVGAAALAAVSFVVHRAHRPHPCYAGVRETVAPILPLTACE